MTEKCFPKCSYFCLNFFFFDTGNQVFSPTNFIGDYCHLMQLFNWALIDLEQLQVLWRHFGVHWPQPDIHVASTCYRVGLRGLIKICSSNLLLRVWVFFVNLCSENHVHFQTNLCNTLYGWWLLKEGTSQNVPIAGFEMISNPKILERSVMFPTTKSPSVILYGSPLPCPASA